MCLPRPAERRPVWAEGQSSSANATAKARSLFRSSLRVAAKRTSRLNGVDRIGLSALDSKISEEGFQAVEGLPAPFLQIIHCLYSRSVRHIWLIFHVGRQPRLAGEVPSSERQGVVVVRM